jgi:AraC-like DNA-binding protein
VADHCGISESGLYALFKKQLGKTPNDIRAEALCQKAIGLLTTTNKSVQEISDMVGFSSTSYFRKVLRKYTGKTPLGIRKDAAF